MTVHRRIVPDASVLLKWVLDADDEPFVEEAHAVLQAWLDDEVGLFLPNLWTYEVGNILCLKRPEDASSLLTALQELTIPITPMDRDLTKTTTTIAIAHRVTFYDASYLAVARRHEATLLTADEKFARRLQESNDVMSLSNIRSFGES